MIRKYVLKKGMTFAAVCAALCLSLFVIGCKTESDDDNSNSSSSATVNADGTTTLDIQETSDGSSSGGFESTTGSIKTSDTNWIGYSGAGYIESLTTGKDVVYSINAASAITDAKIAVKYALWGTSTDVRAVLVYINGSVVNSGNAIYTPYTYKGTKGADGSKRWVLSGYLTGVSLSAGDNQVELVPAPASTAETFNGTSYTTDSSGALPNIDYLEVIGTGITAGTGSVSYYTTTYSANISSFGTVSAVSGSTSTELASGGKLVSGTTVVVTATPESGYKFDCWTGTVPSASNPYSFTLDEDMTLEAHFIPENYTAPTMYGYGTVTDDSGTAYTISGGAGGTAITIDELADLTTYKDELSGNDPYIVTVSGTITTSGTTTDEGNKSVYCSIGSNKTIYGDTASQGRFKNIELRVLGSNVIIRNMMFGEVIADDYFKGSGNDALALNGASHVWIDHCELQSHLVPYNNDGTARTYSSSTTSITAESGEDAETQWKKDFYDGMLDIKNGTSFVTISNCYLHDHWKACLCGSSDTETNGDDAMRVTFYGNYWEDINARMPMFRYGKADVYNNYFYEESTSVCYQSATGVNCRAGSSVRVASNYFKNLKYCIGYYNDTSSSSTGYWNVSNNTFSGSADSAGDVTASTTTWTPCYGTPSNLVSSSSNLSTTVPSSSGVGILTSSDLQ